MNNRGTSFVSTTETSVKLVRPVAGLAMKPGELIPAPQSTRIIVEEISDTSFNHWNVVIAPKAGSSNKARIVGFIYKLHWVIEETELLNKSTTFIANFNEFETEPYRDPLLGPMIGYGSTVYSDGLPVKMSDRPITQSLAFMMLKNRVLQIIVRLSHTIPFWSEMNLRQKTTLVSFADNHGDNFYSNNGFHAISKTISDKNLWSNVPRVLELYAGSDFSQKYKRRIEEAKLWNGTLELK